MLYSNEMSKSLRIFRMDLEQPNVNAFRNFLNYKGSMFNAICSTSKQHRKEKI